jgi:membrane protein YqaA with SNARE-associated domain
MPFMPLGDALVMYLAARDERLFWIYPILAAAGSVTAASLTFWIGRKAGEVGLDRLASGHCFERIRKRVRATRAAGLAIPAILPPPFPLTALVLTCGALKVDAWRFFPTFAALRLLRFSIGAALARAYGRGIVRALESEAFETAVIVFIAIAVAGTIVSTVILWRSLHARPLSPAWPAPRSG